MTYEEKLEAFQLGKIYEVSKGTEKAIAQYQKVIDHAAPNPSEEDHQLTYDTMYRMMLINLQKVGVVMALASEMITRFRGEPSFGEKVLFDIAHVYTRIANIEDAKTMLVELIETYPNSRYVLEANLELGKIYHQQLEQPKEAIPHYIAFLNRTEKYHRLVASFLSDCYLATGDTDSALAVIERYTGIKPVELEEE